MTVSMVRTYGRAKSDFICKNIKVIMQSWGVKPDSTDAEIATDVKIWNNLMHPDANPG
jgi:hypothetical protein